ncbi:MAG: Uma2 family endonuclease [Acetobacteraceae bacterium]|nr:Uma2 family endonuclease [Acetobacteraceae bacterium]
MNVFARKSLPHMTADDFLAWPGDGTGRTYQLVDGEVRPLSPASRTHGIIQARLIYLISGAIIAAKLNLQVGSEVAMQPRLNAATNVRVPDVLVAPLTDERSEIVAPDPVLIAEILSPGNEDDTRDNIRAYATLPSVREMAALSSSRIRAEVHRRLSDGTWAPDPEFVEAGGRLRLDTVALDTPLVEAYATTYLRR